MLTHSTFSQPGVIRERRSCRMLEQELAEQASSAEVSRQGMEEANKGLIKQLVNPLTLSLAAVTSAQEHWTLMPVKLTCWCSVCPQLAHDLWSCRPSELCWCLCLLFCLSVCVFFCLSVCLSVQPGYTTASLFAHLPACHTCHTNITMLS